MKLKINMCFVPEKWAEKHKPAPDTCVKTPLLFRSAGDFGQLLASPYARLVTDNGNAELIISPEKNNR